MKRLLFAFSVLAVLWSAACGGGGPTIQPPPPAGKYSLASLKGTYAFTTSGEVCASCTVAATPLARAGSFIADGNGGITGGVYDVVNQSGASATISINSNSSYTVNADGRGALTFNVASGGVPTSLNFGIVLTSTSSGLMIDETNGIQASTGSGNFILQSTAAFQVSTVAGPYVFDFTGSDGNVGVTNGPFPESLIGQFVVTNGQITTGLEDANDGFALTNGSMAPGTLTADPVNMSTSGRGTAVIEGQNYAFYVVDSTRVRFISSNIINGSGPMLTGDAVQQQANIPANLSAINGGFAFLVGGNDSAGNGLTRVGRFTASANALSKMLMDVNDGANEVQFNNLSNGNISAYDPATGRGQVSFQDSTGQVYAFVFYLSSQNGGVLQDVSPSGTANQARVVADGSINLQSGSPFTGSNISGTYAMNWSGLVTANGNISSTDEEDLLGQITVSNLTLSGTSDMFQFTSPTLTPNLNIGTAGSINFNSGDGTGGDGQRVDMSVNLSNITPIHMVVYFVNPQLAFFANRDNSGTQRIVAGVFEAQQ
jgi:hypothetical protein